ncbi:MAG: efflux transporter outer membrane subunit [Thermoguttaceae bacterium]|jgi:NodT family efflux transporter outer membrane factor (OMF) lipoprotein|nr:efflux transporter outer membrane subunit [Thermoguttaceae bacterium]
MGNVMALRVVAACACFLALCLGCRVGPDYGGPPAPLLHETWRELPDATVRDDHRAVAEWWEGFQDPVLDTLIQEAAQNNLDLRQAALRIFEARAARGIVRGNLFPEVLQDAAYSHIKFPMADAVDQWSFGLGGSWEIDVFGRLRRLVEAADADIAVSVEDYRDTMVILLADVATNYIDARAFQRRIRISQENLETQRRTLQLTQRRFDAELTGELDVAQARANLESTAAGIPNLEAGYRFAVNRLSILLGTPPGTVDQLMAEPAPIPSPPEEIAIGIPADLLRRRPDIRRAEREIAAQTARIGAAIGEMYPKFSILGSFSLDAQDFSKLFDADAIGASVGPRMQWNILNFGRLRSNVQVQDARQQQRVVQYQKAVLRAAEEVDNALVGYVREKQRSQHLAEQVKANQRAVELSEHRYAGGDVDFQRVLDSQRSLLQAEDQLASTEANVAASLVALYRALGGGW